MSSFIPSPELEALWTERGDDGHAIPCSMDARLWARVFAAQAKEQPEIVDEENMLGWFSNAIMAGYDEASRRHEQKEQGSFDEVRALRHELAGARGLLRAASRELRVRDAGLARVRARVQRQLKIMEVS